jgi:Flp pilus assembly protein TadD
MRAIKPLPVILVPLLAWSLAGCAVWPFHRHATVGVRPVAATLSTPGALADDGLYLDARSAIIRRDYAAALEALQAANTRTPDDVRVLNAFGVVYDKLGRFDLSERYYAWAARLDPRSTIIANNLRYSGFLRTGKTPDTTALAQATPAPEPYETLYSEAGAAISGGDDARALATLNAALSRKADDVRVLNALGVVYSRLGRFNLSEHYYAQAAALDPSSPIVANNRAASRLLQARWEIASRAAPSATVVATLHTPTQPPQSPQ